MGEKTDKSEIIQDEKGSSAPKRNNIAYKKCHKICQTDALFP